MRDIIVRLDRDGFHMTRDGRREVAVSMRELEEALDLYYRTGKIS